MARRRTRISPQDPCPCGNSRAYEECCEPVVAGRLKAATAEQLMRSRYTAFAVGDAVHLHRSWHPDTRPGEIRLEPDRRWTGLEIVATEVGSALDGTGVVEFRAHSERDGVSRTLHERSRFARVDGAWVYVDGDLRGDD